MIFQVIPGIKNYTVRSPGQYIPIRPIRPPNGENSWKRSTGEGTGKLWSTLKQLNRQPRVPDNQPVSFYSGTFWDDHRCAILFNRQFTPHLPTTSNTGSSLICKLHKLHCKEMEITSLQVATKASEALGPDGIAMIHLKYLGPGGIHYFTMVINLSISFSIILGL